MAVFTTFDAFVASTNGQTIGDGECWAYINLLWSHLGGRYYTYPPSDPSSTNHGVKWGWLNAEARAANTITHLTQVTRIEDVKRGDIVVTYGDEFGHAGFADEDYNGSGYLQLYSQNYNGRRSVAKDNNNMETFAGAWRYDAWYTPPTPPTPTPSAVRKKKPFPWVLYARRLNNKRNMI